MTDTQKTKEEILAKLENKTRQEVLYEEYLEAEQKFIKSLGDLENFDEKCDCEEPKEALTIIAGDEHFGDEYNVAKRCLICGGDIPEEELY